MSVLTKDEYRRIGSKEFNGYGPAPFPDNRDRVLVAIVDRLTSQETFDQTLNGLDDDQRGTFNAFAWRAASLAVRDRDQMMVRRAIVALALALGRSPSPDIMMQAPLPFRSAELLAMKIEDVLAEVSRIVPPDVLALIANYSQGDLQLAVGSMGYEESGSGSGFCYEFTAW